MYGGGIQIQSIIAVTVAVAIALNLISFLQKYFYVIFTSWKFLPGRFDTSSVSPGRCVQLLWKWEWSVDTSSARQKCPKFGTCVQVELCGYFCHVPTALMFLQCYMLDAAASFCCLLDVALAASFCCLLDVALAASFCCKLRGSLSFFNQTCAWEGKLRFQTGACSAR